MQATSTPTIDAIAAAGSVVGAGSGVSFAGSGVYTENAIVAITRATLRNSVVHATGTVKVAAADSSQILSDAGTVSAGLSLGSAALAVAGAISINDMANQTTALVDQSSVFAGGDLQVEATSTMKIDSLAFAVGAAAAITSGTGVAGGGVGSYSANDIGGGTTAEIIGDGDAAEPQHVIDVGGDVIVRAVTNAIIRGDSGGFSLNIAVSGGSAVSVSLAASIMENEVHTSTTARIRDVADLDATNVTVVADSGTQVESLSMAGPATQASAAAPAVGVSGAGAYSINDVHNTILAAIEDSIVDASAAVLVHAAEDGIELFSLAGGAATSAAPC